MWMPATSGWLFWLRTFSGLAWTGVYLFFVLSGFLIGGVLLQHRTDSNYFSVFYTRRALRILPLYFGLLALFFTLGRTSLLGASPIFANSEIPSWNYWLLIQNFPMAASGQWGAAPLSITWSVALEEQFYLFLPLLIWIVPPRAHLAAFILMAATGPIFRAVAPLAYSPFLMPGAIEALFAGTILAWAFSRRQALFRDWRGRVAALALLIVGGAGMALMLMHVRLGVFQVTLITMFWSGFLWLVLSALGTGWTALLRGRFLCAVGAISYGVYLFHQLIYNLFFIAFTGGPPRHEVGAQGLLIASVSFVGVLLVAGFSYWAMESRLIAIGRKFRYAAKKQQSLVPSPLVEKPSV